MSDKTTYFTLVDTNNNHHEVAVLSQPKSLRLVFPCMVNPDANQVPTQVVCFDMPEGVNNLFGLITDRMHRMKAHNPTFDTILLGERTHKLNPNYKADKKVRDVVFIDGIELKENHTIRFAITDEEDKVVTETKLGFYEVLDMANGGTEVSSFLSNRVLKAGKLPKEVDANGYPMLTKNLRINRILFENCFVNEDFKGKSTTLSDSLAVALNNAMGKVLDIAKATKERGYSEISLKLFDNQFKYSSVNELVKRNWKLLDGNDADRTITVESLLKQVLSEQPKKQQLKKTPVLVVFKQGEDHIHSWETDAKNAMNLDQLMEAALSTGLVDTTIQLDYTVYEDNDDDAEHILNKGAIQPSLMA